LRNSLRWHRDAVTRCVAISGRRWTANGSQSSPIFEPDVVGIYHCYNRCSQRAFLCGFDPLTQTDFSHRKDWIRNGLKSLAASMAVDVFEGRMPKDST